MRIDTETRKKVYLTNDELERIVDGGVVHVTATRSTVVEIGREPDMIGDSEVDELPTGTDDD